MQVMRFAYFDTVFTFNTRAGMEMKSFSFLSSECPDSLGRAMILSSGKRYGNSRMDTDAARESVPKKRRETESLFLRKKPKLPIGSILPDF
jgi:hypothetical protein